MVEISRWNQMISLPASHIRRIKMTQKTKFSEEKFSKSLFEPKINIIVYLCRYYDII
jgi:hypothetical protein